MACLERHEITHKMRFHVVCVCSSYKKNTSTILLHKWPGWKVPKLLGWKHVSTWHDVKSQKSWEPPLKMKWSLQGRKENLCESPSLPADVLASWMVKSGASDFNISFSLVASLCQSRRGAVFSGAAEFILFYYLSYLFFIFLSPQAPSLGRQIPMRSWRNWERAPMLRFIKERASK